MTIWVNEQIDPSGLIYACIACCNESQAKDCHESFKNNLSEIQLAATTFPWFTFSSALTITKVP